MLIFISAFIGVALGLLVGYFLATWILVVLTVVVAGMIYSLFKPTPSRGGGSATLGIFLLFGPGMSMFIIAGWIMWFIGPDGRAYDIDYASLWELLKNILLR